MRTFIAVELDKEIKKVLSKIQDELKTTQADVKWVEPENIHLTLKFLGEVEENKIPKISQILKALSNQTKPFTIRLCELGTFPSPKYPRVVWIGITEGKTELLKLAELLEDSLVQLKFPKEKRGFSAHFTLGRVRSGKNKDVLCQKLNTIQVPGLRQEIKSITLFKSTLTPKGPLYEKLCEENLKSCNLSSSS